METLAPFGPNAQARIIAHETAIRSAAYQAGVKAGYEMAMTDVERHLTARQYRRLTRRIKAS
jgi:hypothetical protein